MRRLRPLAGGLLDMGRMKSDEFYVQLRKRIEQLLRVEPELSAHTLAKRFGVSTTTAQEYVREIREKIREEISNVDHS